MSIYTYVVDHGDNNPAVGAGEKLNGGDLIAVSFSDALAEIERLEEFLDSLRQEKSLNQIMASIDDFRN